MAYARIEKTDGVALVWLDQEGESVNKLSDAMIDEFASLMDDLEADPEVRALVLISGKPDTFIAGADLDRFLQITEPGEAAEISRKGHGLLDRLEASRKPVVAAIHGAALGGGCEVALACHYRLATDDPKTVLGQPEVRLGLLPAGGGTWRLPKRVGLQRALELMLTGRNVYPAQALCMGLVDALIHPYGLAQAAVQAARELASGVRPRRRRPPLVQRVIEGLPPLRRWLYRKARERVFRQTGGHYPAPLKIIDCVEAGTERGKQACYEAEARHFDELMRTPQCKNLIRLFFAVNEKKKNPLADQARPVSRIAVLGAGLMGSGIAEVSIQNGYRVLLKDIDSKALGRAEKAIWQELDRRARKGILSRFERDRVFSRLTGVLDYRGFDHADLVIEAVFEDLSLKQRVLEEVEAVCPEYCIFASNTSSLPIGEIAARSRRPEQVIGMHYFSPVPKMPLLEIVVTPQTAAWVTATAYEVGRRQGKTCIVVNDGPGFYTTRILAPMLNEVFELLKEGAAVEAIDAAMKGFGFPVGPVTLLDEVGIDVGAHVTRVMAPFFEKRGVTTDPLIYRLFEDGYHGRKNGRGFYRYPASRSRRRRKQVNLEIYRYFGGPKRKPMLEKEIQERLSLLMLNEAAFCLQDGILQSARDGDVGAVLGLGFPPFLGGPFRYMDSLGIDHVLELLDRYAQKHGARFTPAPILQDMVARGEKFHPESGR